MAHKEKSLWGSAAHSMFFVPDCWGRFSWSGVLPYILSQLGGAFLAAAVLYMLYNPFLQQKEQEKGLVRGEPGSELTAMCYGEYFPNPARLASATDAYSRNDHAKLNSLVSEPVAMAAELLGTLILALVVFAVSDSRNLAAPTGRLGPVFIGLTVALLIAVIAPLTQACFNPARDFGPRLFALFAGWKSIALPGPRPTGFLTVYIISPIVGAVIGGGFYQCVLHPSLPTVDPERIDQP